MANGKILVTGATGKQGGAVAHQLLERGYPVRAMTRKPEQPAAKALASKGAEIVAGGLDDRGSLGRALTGGWGGGGGENTRGGGGGGGGGEGEGRGTGGR